MSDRSPSSAAKAETQSALARTQLQDEAAELSSPSPSAPSNEPLPRPERRRKRTKADRGLPPDDELKRLSQEFLLRQRKLWPEMVKAGQLPEPTDDVINQMVADFKHRHRTGQVELDAVRVYRAVCSRLAGNYNRYSCDNSSPTSIIDQMTSALDRARKEERFVPWAYLFADYSVSGLDSARQGYTSYKQLLSDNQQFIDTTYVDDFSRASRDEIEWWKLAHLSRRLGKRMIGASDGFDLSAPNWDLQVSLYGIFSRLFLKSLREKVMRGMKGAARRGTCLGKLALGFTRGACRDEQGNIVRDQEGLPKYRPSTDPITAPYRCLMYELYVEKRWSAFRIAKHFNQLRVDGWEGWTAAAVKKLLWSPTAIGVFIWNKTRREFDFEEEKWVIVDNPHSQREVYYDRNLAIVPLRLWTAARKRLAEARRKSPLTGREPSRNQKSATTLFSGSLQCGYCGRELTLNRSAGKYKVLGCLNGPTSAHGCQLSTSKSTRIIESCLLRFLGDNLTTEEAVENLVVRANAFLANEAGRPRINTAPLKANIRKKEAAIKRLFERIENSEDEALAQAYEKRIADSQKEVNQLKASLTQAEVQNIAPPPPMDVEHVKKYLADLGELLNQEIPAAAEALRALTGPITIRQEKIPGKRGGLWIATFSPNLLALLRQVAKNKDYPESITLEYLSTRIWITPETVEIQLDHTPKYEQISGKVAELAAKGASVSTIAAALNVAWEMVDQALDFARTGHRPETKPAGRRTGQGHLARKMIDIAEVVRLRDEQRLTFREIAKRLGVSAGTVVRAYDRANPKPVHLAANNGQKPKRGHYSRLKPELRD